MWHLFWDQTQAQVPSQLPFSIVQIIKKAKKKKKKKEEKGLMLNWHVTAACPVPPLPSFS